MNIIINSAIAIIKQIPKTVWLILLGLLIALGVFWYIQSLKKEVETEKKRAEEAVATDRVIRLDEAKEEVNKATENVNVIKNANYSNVNNDELRQRIINAARKQK